MRYSHPPEDKDDDSASDHAAHAFVERACVEMTEMNEALLIGGLRQHELRQQAEGLVEKLRHEIDSSEEIAKRLRASETRYRRLFEAAQDGVLMIDLVSGKITQANPSICTLLGYTEAELVGKELWQLGRREDRIFGINGFRHLPERGVVRYENLPLLGKTGRVVPVEFVISLYDEGERQVIQCNIRDISERMKTTEALRASEERYRVLCDALPVAAFVCDANAVIQYYNQRAAELWGRHPVTGEEQYCGSLKLWLPDGARLLPARSPMMEVLRTGKARRNVELLIERPDGSRLPVIANFCALVDSNGKTTGVVISFDDISERKRSADQLASQVRRQMLLSETATQLLMVESALGSLDAIFGVFALELGAECFFHHFAVGDGNLQLAHEGGLTTRQRDVLQSIPIGKDLCGLVASHLTPIVTSEIQKSGEEKYVRLRSLGAQAYACYPLKIGQRLYGTLTFVSLLRDRFNAADLTTISTLCNLVAAGMDRKRLLEEASAARDAAEKANAAKDEFLAALSHELRTPLNPVLLLATAAAADPGVPAGTRADFELIAKNVLLEARLIDDLLDSTRIARGKLVLDLQPLLANEVLNEAIAHVRGDIDEKRLTLSVDFDAANPVVRGDEMRLQQIFWNVLRNAVKFTPHGGRISLRSSVDANEKRLLVDIEDTGIGMNPAELERVFEAFNQGDHAGRGGSKKFGGLGLGLAISRTLVELHSGRIRATSDGVGFGSRFTIELPLQGVDVDTQRVSASPPEVPASDAPPAPSLGLRILLVEDDGPTRIALTRLLSVRKHTVCAADTIAEARRLGATETFDLLITDIGLPDGTGYELMEELGRRMKLRGIAMTGYGMEEDIEHSKKVGFSAHLTKPVKIETLDRAIIVATRNVVEVGGEQTCGT